MGLYTREEENAILDGDLKISEADEDRLLDGEIPSFRIKEEEHPLMKLDLGTRFKIKALAREGGSSTEDAARTLQKLPKFKGYDIRNENGRVLIKGPKDKSYHPFDPQHNSLKQTLMNPGEFIKDIADVVPNMVQGTMTTGAAAAGALSGFPLLGASIVGGSAGAAIEGLRQKLGKASGVIEDVDQAEVLTTGLIDAVSPFLFGTGRTAAQVAKDVGKKSASELLKMFPGNFTGRRARQEAEKQLINQQRGLLERGYRGLTRGVAPFTGASVTKKKTEAYRRYIGRNNSMKEIAKDPLGTAGNLAREFTETVKLKKTAAGEALEKFRQDFPDEVIDLWGTAEAPGPRTIITSQIEELQGKGIAKGLDPFEEEYLTELIKLDDAAFYRTPIKPVFNKDGTPLLKNGKQVVRRGKPVDVDDLGPTTLKNYREVREPLKKLSSFMNMSKSRIANAPSDTERELMEKATKAFFAIDDSVKVALEKAKPGQGKIYSNALDAFKRNNALHNFSKKTFPYDPQRDRFLFDAEAFASLTDDSSVLGRQLRAQMAILDDERGLYKRGTKGYLGPNDDGFIERATDIMAFRDVGPADRALGEGIIGGVAPAGKELGSAAAVASGLPASIGRGTVHQIPGGSDPKLVNSILKTGRNIESLFKVHENAIPLKGILGNLFGVVERVIKVPFRMVPESVRAQGTIIRPGLQMGREVVKPAGEKMRENLFGTPSPTYEQ